MSGKGTDDWVAPKKHSVRCQCSSNPLEGHVEYVQPSLKRVRQIALALADNQVPLGRLHVCVRDRKSVV